MKTQNTPATAAPAPATVTPAAPVALRALPKGLQATTRLALGKVCYPRAAQTIACYAAVQAAIAAGNNTAAGLQLVCQQANDPQWLGYAKKNGWVVIVK